MAVDAAPSAEVLHVRRYRCRACKAVLLVVPRDVEPRRHYSRPAIALALALLGLLGQSAATIRRAVSPWRITTTAGWATLRRWVGAVRRGALFPSVSLPSDASAAQVGERVAQVAMSYAPPTMRGAPQLALVFAGAVAMA